MKRVALHNLGCKVNAYELDVMQQMLEKNGYKIVGFDEMADIYIINTCTVTNIADRKSRQMLHRARQKNPDAIVVAVGCYVQTNEEKVGKDACVDIAVGNNQKSRIVEIIDRYLEQRQSVGSEGCLTDVIDLSGFCGYEEMHLERTAEHTRAYIKIQDGCNQFCSYCAIPLARGRVRSRGEESILREIRGLVEKGYQEIVLTGIHISSYGIDLEGKKAYAGESRLIDLVERIHGEIDGLKRIRLGSLEPRIITADTARRLAALPRLCPHFHLSLQSGCDETLKRMNRHYTTGEYLQGVRFLREAFEHPAITTDVIVGFPGETEEEFEETKAFLEEVRFFETHIFKYSRRAKTAADRMPGQLTERVKSRRSEALFEIERRHSGQFRRYYIGKRAEVLFEERQEIAGGAYWVGHTPDYVKVAVPADGRDLSNRILAVEIGDFLTDEVLLAREG